MVKNKEKKGGNLINSPCCNAEIIIHDSESNFSHIDHFSCRSCKKTLNLRPLEVRKNW